MIFWSSSWNYRFCLPPQKQAANLFAFNQSTTDFLKYHSSIIMGCMDTCSAFTLFSTPIMLQTSAIIATPASAISSWELRSLGLSSLFWQGSCSILWMILAAIVCTLTSSVLSSWDMYIRLHSSMQDVGPLRFIPIK